MKAVRIPSGGKIPPIFTPVDVFQIGNPGMPGELIIHNGKLYVYGNGGVTLIEGGIIQTAAIAANSITTNTLKVGVQTFTHNIEWTADNQTKCSWSEGTIQWADETTSTINEGNTGNIGATAYVYYNGTADLQTTTNYSESVGDDKRLLAIIEPTTDDGGRCLITPIYSIGTTISGDKIVTGRIQSADGKTYFDLNEKRIMMNDEDGLDRILIGYQAGGFS